jgi:hypothetical protein
MRNHLLCRLRALAVCFTLAAAGAAHASATLTNFSDLWWNPAESGWGLNIAQQADLMYVTFYVFNSASQPTWYSAVLLHQGNQADGSTIFAGPVYRSTGPSHIGPWDPAAVNTQAVGQAQFRATSTTEATISYQVSDGATSYSTTRAVERYSLREDNIGGSYLGGTSDITSNCINPVNDGLVTDEVGAFTVAHIGSHVAISGPRCTYTGTRTQTGQTSRIEGRYNCTDGAAGTVQFFDVKAEPGGLMGRYTGHGSFCDFSGSIGLGRRK